MTAKIDPVDQRGIDALHADALAHRPPNGSHEDAIDGGFRENHDPDPGTTDLLGRLLEAVLDEHPGLELEQALGVARDLSESFQAERKRRTVRRLSDEIESVRAMNLEAAMAVTAGEFLRQKSTPPSECLGSLVAEGHNAVLVAQYKTGKSTLTENAALALSSGVPFLGTFEVHRPYRVAVCNFEMTADDFRDRIRALGLDAEAEERVLVVQLRGAQLSLTAPAGRRWLTDKLAAHGAEVAILDTFGAASAPSLESENDNAGGRRWLMAWDAIKADVGIHTSLITHHTGRAQQVEGEEHGRGMTALDDWADVRIILTRDRKTGHRFLASEGRSSYALPESRLLYDDTTRRLTLTESNIGEGRARARALAGAEMVADIVAHTPGINGTDLRDALGDQGVTNNGDKAAAITTARTRGLVHEHKKGTTKRHYLGAIHATSQPCPAEAES